MPWYPPNPPDATPYEIESRSELDIHLARGSLRGLTIQGLHLDADPPDLSTVDVEGSLFVGCRFPDFVSAAEVVRRGGGVIPTFDSVPFPTAPARLYTAEDLAAGFDAGGFEGMYDTVVYRHFQAHGAVNPDAREALAQRIHDAGIDDSLGEAVAAWVARHGAASIVGVMGGHEVIRGSQPYRLAAELGQRLSQAGRLVITGGGPGVMEAANLGAYLGRRPAADLAAAVAELATSPDFHDSGPYTAAALAVRRRFPPPTGDPTTGEPTGDPTTRDPAAGGDPVARLAAGGLAIPTWLYGHEPANLFAGQVAKYFSNAIREDMILGLAQGGVVFAPGKAGTVQEVFQAATKIFYGLPGPRRLIFLGREHWTTTIPVESLLRPMLAASPLGDRSGHVHVIDDASVAVELLGDG